MSKIKVGFVGCGRISDLHYLGYKDNPDAELYAIADPKYEVLEKRKKEWNVSKTYLDYKDLLNDSEVEAVEILAPTNLHKEITLEAIRAGKHISLQKPMTQHLEDAECIVEAAKKSDKIFKLNEPYATYPPLVFAKKLIDEGVIGDVHNLRMKMIAWNDLSGWEVPQTAWEWRIAENKAGRPRQTFDHGHHLWAIAWYLLGDIEKTFSMIDFMKDDSIDSPGAIIWKYKEPHKLGMCEYTYSDELHTKSKYYANDEWYEITGSKGLIQVNECNGDILDRPTVSVFTDDGWKHYDNIPADWSEGFINSARNFAKAIKGEEKPLVTAEEGLKILRFSHAIQKSSREKREIYIDEI
ncbi:MAG TPA: Gfo/Idh/MocA family oxidoreductase [Victivallales bacterium]|nr:Gfo/Idh/MocA family oxidoreductase [Victivallales bacterium]